MTTSRRDGGESLLELLVSITLLGIAVASVFPAVLTAISASRMDRESVQAQSMVKSWGEFVTSATTDASYVPCATTSNYNAVAPAMTPWSYQSPLPALPSNFSASVAAVEYWDGTAFVASCSSDTGLQRVKLRIAVSGAWSGVDAFYWVAVRKPCASGC